MDLAFDGMQNPDQNAPDWNGIVETTWNWGDASPPSNEIDAWHIFEQTGYYTVTLTVRDGYGTGDSNSTTIGIWVSGAPTIITEALVAENSAFSGALNSLRATATDSDMDSGMLAWRDDDVLVDSDNDGIPNNDRDTELNMKLSYAWDLDDSVDADENGNFNDDWVMDEEFPGRIDALWNETGEYVVRLKVCDDTLVCTIETFEITVRDADSEDTSQIPAAQALASRTTTQSSKAVRSAPGEIREKFTPSSASFPPARLTQKAVDDRSSTS